MRCLENTTIDALEIAAMMSLAKVSDYTDAELLKLVLRVQQETQKLKKKNDGKRTPHSVRTHHVSEQGGYKQLTRQH